MAESEHRVGLDESTRQLGGGMPVVDFVEYRLAESFYVCVITDSSRQRVSDAARTAQDEQARGLQQVPPATAHSAVGPLSPCPVEMRLRLLDLRYAGH